MGNALSSQVGLSHIRKVAGHEWENKTRQKTFLSGFSSNFLLKFLVWLLWLMDCVTCKQEINALFLKLLWVMMLLMSAEKKTKKYFHGGNRPGSFSLFLHNSNIIEIPFVWAISHRFMCWKLWAPVCWVVLRDCSTLRRWELTAGSYIIRSLEHHPQKKLMQLSLGCKRTGHCKMNKPGSWVTLVSHFAVWFFSLA